MDDDRAATTPPPTGFQTLADSECLGLLRAGTVGRLGLTANALPVVVPVRYGMAGRCAVFAVAAGATLGSARNNVVACLAIDAIDAMTGVGWMVLATGRLREIADPSAIAFDDGLPLHASVLNSAEHIGAMDIELLSGTSSRPAWRLPPIG